MARCLRAFGGLPETLATDREGALHAGLGKPTDAYASFCGQLAVAWALLRGGRCRGQGRGRAAHRVPRDHGRQFVGPLDFQEQLDRWFSRRANVRLHRALRERPADRHAEDRGPLRLRPSTPPRCTVN